jgi:hypothetical protein
MLFLARDSVIGQQLGFLLKIDDSVVKANQQFEVISRLSDTLE